MTAQNALLKKNNPMNIDLPLPIQFSFIIFSVRVIAVKLKKVTGGASNKARGQLLLTANEQTND
jgi:hypothetical protein